MNESLITISQYATARGISKQAVYKQLNNKLKEYVVEVDGKKYIDKKALSGTDNQRLNNNEQPNNQQLNNQIQLLLESQLEEKDKTIQSLLKQIETLQEQNSKLIDQYAMMGDLLSNSQKLLAVEKLALEDKRERKGIFNIFRKKDKKDT